MATLFVCTWLITVSSIIGVNSLTVTNGTADFSDEPSDTKSVPAAEQSIKTINTNSLQHFTQFKSMYLSNNDLRTLPDFSPIADTLQLLSISQNPKLETVGNQELAALNRLEKLYIAGTNFSLLTTTCPTNHGYFGLWAKSTPRLDFCDCQMIWLKVSKIRKKFKKLS